MASQTVYQEPQLFAELTVSENIFVGRELVRGGRVDWAAQHERVLELLTLLGLPEAYATRAVGDLSIAEQQQVSSPRRWPATPRYSSSTNHRRSSPIPRSRSSSASFAG